MEFLDSLFSSNKKTTNEKRLVDSVEKIDNSEDEVFIKIMNDLGTHIEQVGMNESNMRKMGYAYARRLAAAGLCAQGIWSQEEYDYTMTIFHSFQQMTEQSVEFQEKAGAQAMEYIQSYDSRLDKRLLMGLVAVASDDASNAINKGIYFSLDDLVGMFKR